MKFTTITAKSAKAIARSNRCIKYWEQVIAKNIMSAFTGSAWNMICAHRIAIAAERKFIKQQQS